MMSDLKAAKAASKALRQSDNEWSNKYFAISMGVIILLFAIHHWASVFHVHYGPKKSIPTLTSKYRAVRRFLFSSIIGIRADRSLLYIVYWATNLILSLTNVDLRSLTYVAKRLGWISVANMVFLVFLALKNTPLAPLTAKSYDKLRPLHKVAGYTCIFMSCMHGIVYLIAWSESDKLEKMTKSKNLAGAIAGMAMVVIGFSTITKFMRKFFELFYVLHIIMFILILIMVGMHRPEFSSSTVIIVIFTACLWVLDRIIRAAKIIWNLLGNSATVTILPDNTVRVKLSRRVQSRPGSHAFLWLPAIRSMETHPFTMLSFNSTEFVIRVYDGFTHDLYKAAQKAPGKSLRCSVDGGYGQVPDFNVFDKAILVAGGSGASFTFAIAIDLVEKSASKLKAIDFVWMVRNRESIEWFAQELKKLQNYPKVNVLIHVTRETDLSCVFSQTSPIPPGENICAENNVVTAAPSTLYSPVSDHEKGGSESSENTSFQTQSLFNKVRPGRPDIGNLIAAAASSAGKPDDHIIVGACGPEGLIDETRRAVVWGLHDDCPSITLYTEEFKW